MQEWDTTHILYWEGEGLHPGEGNFFKGVTWMTCSKIPFDFDVFIIRDLGIYPLIDPDMLEFRIWLRVNSIPGVK